MFREVPVVEIRTVLRLLQMGYGPRRISQLLLHTPTAEAARRQPWLRLRSRSPLHPVTGRQTNARISVSGGIKPSPETRHQQGDDR